MFKFCKSVLIAFFFAASFIPLGGFMLSQPNAIQSELTSNISLASHESCVPFSDYPCIIRFIDFLQNVIFQIPFFQKLVVIGPIIFLLIFLERIIPFKKIPFFRSGFFSDFGWYSIIQNQLLQLLIINYLRQFSLTHHFRLISGLPLWVQVIIILIVFDFATYWGHRLLHESDFLWRFHELHHSSIEIDWLSGLRQHPVDLLFAAVINALLFCLSGADFRVAEIIAVIVTVHGIYSHSNFKNKIGKLQYLFISTEMHRMHHLRDIKYQKANYGTVFSIWDWIFKTARYPNEEEYKDIPFGTEENYPQNFLEGNIHVFRKIQ